MSWWSLLPATAALLVLAVAPGAVALRLLGVRGLVALGAGAPVTLGVVGAASVLLARLGVEWRLPAVLAVLLAVVVVAGLLGRLVGHPDEPRGLDGRRVGAVVLALVAGFVLLTLPLLTVLPSPDAPLQQWDAVFHLNAVVSIRETGIATPLGGLSPLYGGGTLAPYYPTGWHALLAIVPAAASVPAVTNVGIAVLGAGVWLLGLVGLTREVTGPRPLPLVLVPLLAATFVGYPTVQLTVLAQLPNGLSTALLPGTLALMLRAVRAWTAGAGARAAVVTLAAGAATVGVVSGHASGLFSLALLAGPIIVAAVVTGARQWWRAGRHVLAAGTVAALAAAVVAAPVVAANVDAFAAVVGFERASGHSHLRALREVVLDQTLAGAYPGDGWQHAAITLATLAGIVVVLRRRRDRWLVAGFVLAVGLAVLAAGPEGHPLRWLAGFWYTQAGRIAPVAAVPAILLAAIALTALVDRARSAVRHPTTATRAATAAVAVVVLAVVATAVVRLPLQQRVVASAFVPGELAFGTMATAEELELMHRLGEDLPADAVVVGDPFNGSALLPAVAGVDVVFPQLGPSGMSDAQLVLQAGLSRVHEDPAVCAALTELDVTHLYQDTAGEHDGAKTDERTAAMRDVDVSTGFTLVDSAGTAAVYRIDACGG
ncbi:DUF6541 family protein [Georgenia sp. MJ173]|uniref:DUF6541 family protein n=1 Tax=Georgenia sunbinii TaxID=3117728 RepID=UPI002F2673C3